MPLPCRHHCHTAAASAAVLPPPPPPPCSRAARCRRATVLTPCCHRAATLPLQPTCCHCHRRAAADAAVIFVFIVVIVAVIIAISITVAATAFSWLLFVVCAPVITVATGVFVATTK
jgi:hypothetical protein